MPILRLLLVTLLMALGALVSAQPAENRAVGALREAGQPTPRNDPGEFDEQFDTADHLLSRRGTHLFKYMLWDVYWIASYLPAGVAGADEILDAETPRVLVIRYRHAISREDLAKATEKGVEKLDRVDPKEIRDELDALYQMYQSVQRGDEYQVIYRPGKGTELVLNGTSQGIIESARFAEAFFALWLADDGINTRMARRLRGQ